jgi:hypothetical protein
MEQYIQQIQTLTSPTFQEISKIVKNSCGISRCGINCLTCKPWEGLNHGVDLLDTPEKLCKYLCAYGDMHKAKIETALAEIQKKHNLQDILKNNFSIIDWGCGQGLATICFFDYIKELKIQNKAQKIILIEPSPMALDRAKLYINAYLKDESKIKTVKRCLDGVTYKS